ncbi:ABC transporter permease [Microbulbifer yueqingensis]|uniref:Transport permease protein n=1 Tax=Microbulbifer yueqingensis TaxID=658219 RepID=A0A1G9AC30_9GAMM|nr:ABC transporter permease [Microbulbifer yueqingensis]SDK24100.1 lipopolysaccharide transport system permease protein [Microbulbifer yueqingensis]
MQLTDLVIYKTYAELRRDIASAYLGMLWWVLEPLLYMGAFYLIFALGIRSGGENFVSFLLCGLVPWKWFASTLMPACSSVLAHRGLIQQVYIPKAVLPLIPVAVNTVKFLLVLVLLLALLLALGHQPSLAWLYILPVALTQLYFILGCSLILAAVVPFVVDVRTLVNHGLMMLMFASGIFFDIQQFSPDVREFLYLNPMISIIESYRNVLLNSSQPDWTHLANVSGVSTVLCLLGLFLFRKFDRYYPKVMS